MRLIIQNIEKLESILTELRKNGVIKNYVITVPLYMGLQVKLHVSIENPQLIDTIFAKDTSLSEYQELIDIEQIADNEYSSDYIKLMFKPDEHRNLSIRRRFHDLIHPHTKVETPCPVVTFYSYKGGVGRTTLLTCYAQYLANMGKQVVIIDCDFEAPGFTNYFGFRFGNDTQQKCGLIEYILDRQFLAPKGENVIKEQLIGQIESLYSYKVGEEYTKGDIRVIKAGNYEANNLTNYLEGLARLDIGNIPFFQTFLSDLKIAFDLKAENSVILIDSRTGFNDTFATLYALSDSIVGVFGTNTQNQTGLYAFLDTLLPIRKNAEGEELSPEKNIMFVQSFSSQSKEKNALYSIAKEYFDKYPERFLSGNAENPHENRFLKFEKEERLAEIGEASTSKEREIELYQENMFKKILARQDDLEKLFENILPYSEKKKDIPIETTLDTANNIKQELSEEKKKIGIKMDRNAVLAKIVIPNIRAERIRASQKKQDFFFRRGMGDIFNWDKFIISGTKGTGKTFIYEAMDIPIIQKELCSREKKNIKDYFFVNILPVHDSGNATAHFNTNLFTEKDKEGVNNFFERFWVVYVCNKVFEKPIILAFIDSSKFDLSWLFDINEHSTQDAANWFCDIIRDNDKYALVERQLFALNQQLRKADKKLIIFFDQLDFIVEPIQWEDAVAKLVNYWRENRFSHILPKIFLRSDLIRLRLTSVNSTELFRRSINIEWTKEELFAYFLAVQLNENPSLIQYFEQKGVGKDILKHLEDWINNDIQIPTERETLMPLVNVFFGKSAHKYEPYNMISFGISYDWFEINLHDGNDDLSLRPFIWLLEKALVYAKADKYYQNAVIGAKHYAAFTAIEYAGEKYYTELRDEKGNKEILDTFQQFLRETSGIARKGTYLLSEFDHLLTLFIKANPKLFVTIEGKQSQINHIKTFLTRNGVIREKRNNGGRFMNYEVPFLYKYYLLFPNA